MHGSHTKSDDVSLHHNLCYLFKKITDTLKKVILFVADDHKNCKAGNVCRLQYTGRDRNYIKELCSLCSCENENTAFLQEYAYDIVSVCVT